MSDVNKVLEAAKCPGCGEKLLINLAVGFDFVDNKWKHLKCLIIEHRESEQGNND